MIDTNSLDCTNLMEFVYLARSKIFSAITRERQELKKDLAEGAAGTSTGYPVVMYVNRV